MIYEVIKTKSQIAKELVTTRDLRGNEYRIYEFLVKNANNKTGEVMWNVGAIAFYTCVHPSTVRRVLKRLKDKNKILVQYRKNAYNNENTSNIYTICDMLSEDALKIKKAYIEEYPTIVDQIDVAEDLAREVFEKLFATKEEEVEEVIETEVVPVSEEVEVPEFIKMLKSDMLETRNNELQDMVSCANAMGVEITVQQASRIKSIYPPSMISNALYQCEIIGATTYFELDKILNKLYNEKQKITELRCDFKKIV